MTSFAPTQAPTPGNRAVRTRFIDSSALLEQGDFDGLRRRGEEEGYLFFAGLLPAEAIRRAPGYAGCGGSLWLADARQSDREHCLAAGMDDYISKPITPRDLTERLTTWVGSPKKKDQMYAIPTKAAPKRAELDSFPVFDRQSFLERMMDDEEFALEIVQEYISNNPVQMGMLKESLRTNDVKTTE